MRISRKRLYKTEQFFRSIAADGVLVSCICWEERERERGGEGEVMDGTILKEILRNCTENGDRPVYHWVDRHGAVERVVTYAELGQLSRELSATLLDSLKLRHGDKALLCYPPGLDPIITILACLEAGIIAGIIGSYSYGCSSRFSMFLVYSIFASVASNQWP